MNVMEELRKRRRIFDRANGHKSPGEQLGKRPRRIMAKAAERQHRPITLQEIGQAAIMHNKRRNGPNWAQQFYALITRRVA